MRNHSDDGEKTESLASGKDQSESVRELLCGYGHPDGKKVRGTFGNGNNLSACATVNAILGTVLRYVIDKEARTASRCESFHAAAHSGLSFIVQTRRSRRSACLPTQIENPRQTRRGKLRPGKFVRSPFISPVRIYKSRLLCEEQIVFRTLEARSPTSQTFERTS